jgi:hypothetical protein
MNSSLQSFLFIAMVVLTIPASAAEDGTAIVPVLTVKLQEVNPFNVANFIQDSVVTTGLGEPLAKSIDRELLQQPWNLSPATPRLMGLSVFWSPGKPMNPLIASFVQPQPGENIDPSQPSPSADSANFKVSNAGPNRWVHGWYPPEGFGLDTNSALFNHYFRVDRSLIWSATRRELLNAELPQVSDKPGIAPGVSFGISTIALPIEFRRQLDSMVTAAADTALQRRNNESANRWLGRIALIKTAAAVFRSVLVDGAEINGILRGNDDGSLLGNSEFLSTDAHSLRNLTVMTPSTARLSGIRSERPWIVFRTSLVNRGLLRDVLEYAEQQLKKSEGSDSDIHTLVKAVLKSDNLQIAFAGITPEDGVPSWVVGWHFESLSEVTEESERFVRHLVTACLPEDAQHPIGSAGTQTERWIAFGGAHPQQLVDRINQATINDGTERTRELLEVKLDLLSFNPSHTSFNAFETGLGTDTGSLSYFFKLFAEATDRLKKIIPESSDEDWKAALSLSGADGKLALQMNCGRNTSAMLAAGALQLVSHLRRPTIADPAFGGD